MGESLEAMAATYRAALAQKYLSSQTAQAVLGIDSTMLTAWRKERRLLAVWHRPANDWLYPDFQFEDGSLIKEVPRLEQHVEHSGVVHVPASSSRRSAARGSACQRSAEGNRSSASRVPARSRYDVVMTKPARAHLVVALSWLSLSRRCLLPARSGNRR